MFSDMAWLQKLLSKWKRIFPLFAAGLDGIGEVDEKGGDVWRIMAVLRESNPCDLEREGDGVEDIIDDFLLLFFMIGTFAVVNYYFFQMVLTHCFGCLHHVKLGALALTVLVVILEVVIVGVFWKTRKREKKVLLHRLC